MRIETQAKVNGIRRGCFIFLVCVLLFAFFGSEAWSSPKVSVHGGGYSKHIIKYYVTNESHDLAAIQLDSYVVGRFNNSYGRETWFSAYEWSKQLGTDVEAYVWAGITRGYSHCIKGSDYDGTGSSKLCPMIAPGLRYTRWALQPSLILVGYAVALEARYVF